MQDVMALVDEAVAWVKDRAQYAAVPEDVRYNDKWIIRSAMQKAIRRGYAEVALQHAASLASIDHEYAWYSLLTCANEDVGFGDPDGLLFAYAGQLKTFREKVGPGKLMSAIIVSLCAAPKTRSQCELSWVVDTSHEDVIREFTKMSTKELVAKVEAPDAGECYAALAVLRRVLPKELQTRNRDVHGCEMAKDIMTQQLTKKLARVAHMSIDRPMDNMSVAAFPCFRIGNEAGDIDVVYDDLPPSLTINGYASEAYDMHEMAGKKAMAALYKQLRTKHPRFAAIKTRSGTQLIGNAVFVVEGAQVDRRILCPDLMTLKNLQDSLSMAECGVPDDDVPYVLELVRSKIERLNSIRKWATGAK